MSQLEIRGLSVAIGGNTILHGIDLSLERGTLSAIVGANGAGKTTLLRAISQLLSPSAGEIRFDGRSLAGIPPHLLARQGLVHVPQGRQIIATLSVEKNLLIGANSLPSLSDADRRARLQAEFERFPVLQQRRGLSAGSLSGGEQQMLAISRALMMKPTLLMLDEPSLGLAPQVVSRILVTLRDLAASGMTVLLVEQAAFLALKHADVGHVVQNGRIVLSAPAAELLKDKALIEGYLG